MRVSQLLWDCIFKSGCCVPGKREPDDSHADPYMLNNRITREEALLQV